MVQLSEERDVDTLRQISLLLDRENQRLIDRVRRLTAELARLRGVPNVEQLEFALLQELQQAREQVFRSNEPPTTAAPPRRPRHPGHGPRPQPALPIVDIRHELPPDQRACPACGGELTEMAGQAETSERVTTVKLTYQVEHHVRQKYRCGCNGAVVTAPAPPTLIPGGRDAPEFAVGVAVAKYADHLPLERQVRMMARDGLIVDSQTLWDQLNAMARHLEPTYEGLGRRALEAPVINVDETRWAILGSAKAAAGTVWTVRAPTVAFYRILSGKSAEEGRQVLAGYRGTVVADGYAVYDVLARDGPGFMLAHCWAHAKRKYDEVAEHWPSACAEIGALIGELYAIERLVPGPFPGDAAAQALRQQLRQERSKPLVDRIWHWATVQVGLPRSDFGKAVRYMLERWAGLTRFVDDPRVPLDNNAAERALRGPVVGRKNHYGSRSLRGTQVAALFYTLCETAKLAGVDPNVYLLRTLHTAIAQPGAITFPEALLSPTLPA
ncbi:MAG TPA: IS66 family transposase [Methylomirabilota bacterium]|nr:IS66 family transposase [Methylomirabilota bacterium]